MVGHQPFWHLSEALSQLLTFDVGIGGASEVSGSKPKSFTVGGGGQFPSTKYHVSETDVQKQNYHLKKSSKNPSEKNGFVCVCVCHYRFHDVRFQFFLV